MSARYWSRFDDAEPAGARFPSRLPFVRRWLGGCTDLARVSQGLKLGLVRFRVRAWGTTGVRGLVCTKTV